MQNTKSETIGANVTKQCRDCKRHLPLSAFRGTRPQCKECAYKAARQRRQDNPPAYAVSQAKYRAKKKGLDFDITTDYIKSIDSDICPYLAIPMVWNYGQSVDGRAADNSKSLDRIDSSKGYVKGNVIVCSWRANNILSNATLPEMELITQNFRRILNPTQPTTDAA